LYRDWVQQTNAIDSKLFLKNLSLQDILISTEKHNWYKSGVWWCTI